MNKIQVLDCTLRDGGYCNQWNFGFKNIITITNELVHANIDIIECGFLTNRVGYDENISKYTNLAELSKVIPTKREGKIFVAMMNYGEYDVNSLPKYDGKSIDGIRVAFHKKDVKGALLDCKVLKTKGYHVFVQAMVSLSYRDEEFLSLIDECNEFKPYAFYIVDSFGMMKSKDLIRMFYMVEHNLNSEIKIGVHSHNNMQLAFSNAQELVSIRTNRDLIVDSSIYGMGRGAGNLNTELFVQHLNENYDCTYDIKPLLMVIDRILNGFYERNYWGYSLPNYLSASHNAHPDYASYLDDKKTLTVKDMNEIFNMMSDDKKVTYDKAYIESLYLKYMEMGNAQDTDKKEMRIKLRGKKVLLIAPGKSAHDEQDVIVSFINNNDVVVVSVNFEYPAYVTDYIFVSNIRRYEELDAKYRDKCIITSNISSDDAYLKIDYKSYLSDYESVKDNAGLMAIKYLIESGVKSIYLAGFDGYSHDVDENYSSKQLEIITRNAVLDSMNIGMQKIIKEYANLVTIKFLTTPKHVKL